MYFSTLNNNEVQHFHEQGRLSFSTTLTQILSDDTLFLTEQMNTNIYRVFPLFYCDKVVSSNTDDITDNTRCLILIQQETETYITFKKENDIYPPYILQDSLLDTKKIGYNLTDAEYNSLIYRLRKQGVLNKTLSFEENNEVKGDYGEYNFDYDTEAVRNHEGLIITEHLKNTNIFVTLVNQFFKAARYTLTFKVLDVSDVNIEDYLDDYVTYTDVVVECIPNEQVEIPLSDFRDDSVLLFDFTVNVSFNVPEIVVPDYELDLFGSHSGGCHGEVELIPALSGSDIEGKKISVYHDEELLDVVTTDSHGEATLTYELDGEGFYNFSAKYRGMWAYWTQYIRCNNP